MLLKVQCEKCKTKYKLDEARIQGKGAKITCPRCRHVFVVMKDAPRSDTDEEDASDLQEESTVNIPVAPAAAAPVVPLAAPPAAGRPVSSVANPVPAASSAPEVPYVPRPTNVDALNWKEVGLTTFKVKVAIGLVYDFSDVGTLKKYISEKRVVSTDRVSFDGKTWSVLKDVGPLDEFFIDQWVNLKREKLAEDQKNVPKGPTGPTFGEPKREPKPVPASPRNGPMGAAGDAPRAEAPTVQAAKTPWSADAGRDGGQGKGLLGHDLFDDIAGEEAMAPPPLTTARRADESPIRRTQDSIAPTIGTPIPGAMGGSSSAAATRRISAFEVLTLLLLLGVSGYLGWRYSNEASAAGSTLNADPQAGIPELEQVIQQNFPVAYAASQRSESVPPPAGTNPGANPAPGDRPKVDKAGDRGERKEGAERPERHAKEASVREERKAGKGTISVDAIKPEDLFQLGQASLKQRDYDGAIESLRTAVEMRPRNEQFQYTLGYAQFLSGKLPEAEATFQKTLSLNPGRKEAHKWLGEIYSRQGNKEQALKQWKTYVEGNPSDAAVIQKKIEKLTNS